MHGIVSGMRRRAGLMDEPLDLLAAPSAWQDGIKTLIRIVRREHFHNEGVLSYAEEEVLQAVMVTALGAMEVQA